MNSVILIGIGIILLLILFIGAFFVSRLVTVPPSEALIISGSNDKNGSTKIVHPGGRVFVIPILQSSKAIPLTQMKLSLEVEGVDNNSIPVALRATANIKVGNDPQDIRAAAERFGEYKNINTGIEQNVEDVLLGSLRAIVSEMSVEDLLMKRAQLSDRVKEIAGSELRGMGLIIDSLTVNQINDPNGYIKALSVPETQKVLKEARIAEADAEREAQQAEVTSKINIAEKNRELEIRRSQLFAETEAAKEVSEAAGPLSKAEQEEQIAKREQKVAVENARLRDSELDREVRRPADAEKYKKEQDAEAQKSINIAIAEAEAESIRIKGLAEAEAIRNKGLAEAEAMEKKADAYAKYNEAAVLQLVVDKLPELAKEFASPLGNIDNMTVVGTDGANGVTKTVSNGFSELNGIIEGFTGISLTNLLSTKKEEDNFDNGNVINNQEDDKDDDISNIFTS